jgi:RimJ/RimL family protein N-acetyltransferase
MTGAARPVGSPVDPKPASRPGPEKLVGQYGSVVQLDARRDAGSLWRAVRGDDNVWTYLAYGPFAAESQFANWLAERETLNDPYSYAVLDRDGGAVGIVTLMSIRPDMRVIEVGNIFYSPMLQRTPLGTEAQYLLACHAIETLGYRRYEWKCDSLNAPSRRAAARYGFIFEGVFRQHMIVKGCNRDTAWFSIIDSEWPVRRANFERWLAPENFDREGRQKVSLAALNVQKV